MGKWSPRDDGAVVWNLGFKGSKGIFEPENMRHVLREEGGVEVSDVMSPYGVG